MWPDVLYEFVDYGGESFLLPKEEAIRVIRKLRRLGPDWRRLWLKHLPRLYHEEGDVYRYGRVKVRVREAGFPYVPGTYMIAEVINGD